MYSKGEGKEVQEQEFVVDEDWVYNTYGKDIAAKLVDCEEYNAFMTVTMKEGGNGSFIVNDRKIVRVHYNEDLNIWVGLLEDGVTFEELKQSDVEQQLGEQFVHECKYLGSSKFVPVPVGSIHQSIMELVPEMRVDGAPAVKFMQRDKNTCVFSSFASALHSTGNANLQKLAQRLHAAGTQHEGEGCVNSLKHVQVLVQQHCKWLQLVRMRSYFDWQESIGEGDIFLV